MVRKEIRKVPESIIMFPLQPLFTMLAVSMDFLHAVAFGYILQIVKTCFHASTNL